MVLVKVDSVCAPFLPMVFSPGAIDQAHQLAHGHGFGHHRLAVGFLAHVTFDESRMAFAKLLRDGFAFFSLHVGDHDLAAVGDQHARRAFAQP